MLEHISREHTLVLSSFVIDELMAVAERKFPHKKDEVDKFLSILSYEFVYTPHTLKRGLFELRDMKDYPVLYSAITENVDILITGDKDFQGIDIEHPAIFTPSDFIDFLLKRNE